MSQLMEKLFDLLDAQQSEEEAQAVAAARDAVRAAEQHLTNQEFEALWDAIHGIDAASNLECFARGFRLGVQLTLEGLRPV